MEVNYLDLIYTVASALDCVERQLNNESANHSLHVAYLCIKAAKRANMKQEDIMDLATCALLHDNALSEYIASEYEDENEVANYKKYSTGIDLHCTIGEDNIKDIRFLSNQYHNAVLYHHEHADGSGPFEKNYKETPLFARMIHLANQLDLVFPLRNMTKQLFEEMKQYIAKEEGVLFDSECSKYFTSGILWEDLIELSQLDLKAMMYQELQKQYVTLSESEIVSFARLFAKIIDYKSSITKKHSEGVAKRAYEMAQYYGYSSIKSAKFYLAGALHDIGKLIVDSDILEKDSKLTPSEYRHIQSHALASYEVLKRIEGMEDILEWASYHHERLDGTGYPFGLSGEDLSQEARLMACIDIYQALVEVRSYKKNMSHNEAMKIINQWAKEGKLDEGICRDLDAVYGSSDE